MDAMAVGPSAPHGLESLARGARVSARQLRRLFRAETGMTTGRYLESVRLECAQALLEGGNDDIAGGGGLVGLRFLGIDAPGIQEQPGCRAHGLPGALSHHRGLP
ncbi:helix-turn-helix domain-containing protein [Streptomyces sp. NPDC017890]|uniref:helix-turn-helix domain-containing protein n=1 Tax=Streptomyces sp. NPDC017890 TaxID=3365015 RepID=UPI00378AF38E